MYGDRVRRQLAPPLAAAFLAGRWTEDAMVRRAAEALTPRPRWLRKVVRGILDLYPRPPFDRPRELARAVEVLILGLPHPASPPARPVVRRFFLVEERMADRRRWPVLELQTAADLADWLELDAGQLGWLSDPRGLEARVEAPRLRNYTYLRLPRPSGLPRVVERPKLRLKEIQRTLLHEILDAIPPHEAAHGFTRGRSAVTHAQAHTGRRVVMRFDLEDFFASVEARRVFGIFRSAGYGEGVAHALTAFATNVVPPDVVATLPDHGLRRRLATPHLPQGAPTSPALANLCAFGLDRRLTGLADRFGARYTRYADDLVFSGGTSLLRGSASLRRAVGQIARSEGFTIHEAKSQLMTRAGRQRVGGVVVNDRTNVARQEYDRLRAILHDARRNGPEHANRSGLPDFEAHLRGRIAWIGSLNAARGEKLLASFREVDWPRQK